MVISRSDPQRTLRDAEQPAGGVSTFADHRSSIRTGAIGPVGVPLAARDVLRSLAEIVVPAQGTWLAVGRLDPLAESTPFRLVCVELFHIDSELAPALGHTMLADFPFYAEDCRGPATADATEQAPYRAPGCDLSRMRFTLTLGQDARHLMRLAARTAHALTVPLAVGDRVLGAMTLGAPAGPHPDRDVLADVALRFARAMEHSVGPGPQAARQLRTVGEGAIAFREANNRAHATRRGGDPNVRPS
jgi:hypothetical protein